MRHPASKSSLVRLASAALAALLLAPGVASAAPRPVDAAFPRLGVWWPPSGAATESLARHDLAVLHDFETGRAEALRRAAPGAVVLSTTSASEIAYDAWDATKNDDIREIPAQWLLTQAGSRLAAPVGVSDTTFRVEATRTAEGARLFVPGDSVVVGDEIARVDAIAGTTLTVRRGKVKAPSSHAAGTRVAAVISRWHGLVVLDLSDACPRLKASDSPVAETWREYAARRGAAQMANGPWDGLFIDRADGEPSWMVSSGEARSIDVDRTNRLPASYDAFDASWDGGVRDYERRLRDAVGPDRYLMSNWGRPEFDLLNGSNFEAFPAAGDGRSYNGTWQQTTFGPLPTAGGYLEWLSLSLAPSLSMVSSYRVDSSTGGPLGSGEPAPITTADVRKARFGLGTALLGDGFYSYSLNDDGPDASTLAWFDVFDGGGLGRGYLGRPSAEMTRAVPPLATPDMSGGGGFETLAGWDLWLRDGYEAALALDATRSPAGAPTARVTLTSVAGTGWQARLTRGGVAPVTAGSDYTVSFWARADRRRTMEVWLQGDATDTRKLAEFGDVTLDTAWRRYEFSTRASATSGPLGTRLHFGVGSSAGDVWVDGVRVQRGTTAVWRRDYGGGAVVVNGSAATMTVGLGERLQAFRGTQDPAVDDGRAVETLTIPPYDARILVRPAVQALAPLDRSASLWRRAAASAEAARKRVLLAEPGTTGGTRLRLAAAAAAWTRARDACLAALAAEQRARAAAAAGDGAPARAAMDAAVVAGTSAVRATAVRDPLRSREGLEARRAANAALAAVSAAHAILP